MSVAVLVYARTVMRTGETAVRTALGATRGRIVTQLFAEAFVLTGVSTMVGLGIVAVGLRMLDRSLAEILDGSVPFWMHSGVSAGTVAYALALAVLAAVIVGVVPALRATGRRLDAAMGSIGSGAKARLGTTWTVLIVAQVALTVAMLPTALLKVTEMVMLARRESGFAPNEYLSSRYVVELDANASLLPDANKRAVDSAHVIMKTLMARLAAEPGVAGATVTTGAPWEGRSAMLEVDGVTTTAQRGTSVDVDTSFFNLFRVPVLAGRQFAVGDVVVRPQDRPVLVNRSFVIEILGGLDAVGRRVRYQGYGNDVAPWMTIAGVVEDFPARARAQGETRRSARIFHLTMPGETDGGQLTIRLRGQTPETFAAVLRRITMSVDPMLQVSKVSSLDVMYRDYAKSGTQLALFVLLVAGSVILLSAAGVHSIMSFAVNQRRREIGIRSALGASAREILRSVLSSATRQLVIGAAVGLVIAGILDRLTGGEVMSGKAATLVPGTAAFMFAVGFLAAAGPARRGLRVQPTEALRAE
jgi:hypothetical protein